MPNSQFPLRSLLRAAASPPALAITIALLSAPIAHAQWAVSDASGNPLQSTDPRLCNDGSAVLVGSGALPSVTPTGTYNSLSGWWLGAYSPNSGSAVSPYAYLDGVEIGSVANNCIANAASYNGGYVGFYNPNDYSGIRADGTPIPPNIGGEVKASKSDTLTAYFVWTGPNPVPDHADFLITTSVNATASVNYGQSPATSGLSSSATASLGSDTATASASARGDNHPSSVSHSRLIRVTPNGRIATIALKGSGNTDVSNSVAYGAWEAPSYHYYMGDPANGYQYYVTSANASISATGNARKDSRDLILNSNLSTSHKSSTTGLPVADTRDPDGTLNLTTIGSYHSYTTEVYVDANGNSTPINVDHPVINTLTFTPQFIGWDYVPWTDPRSNTVSDVPNIVNPNTWSWWPNNSNDYWDTGICQMWWSTPYYQDGQALGQPTGARTYTVSYNAIDNLDGAAATAKAVVKLHDQWENKVAANPATTLNQKRTYAPGPGYAGVSNNTKIKFTSPATCTSTITASVTLGFKFSPSFDVGWCKVLGIDVNASATISGSFAITVPGPLLDPGFATYPFVLTTWQQKNYLVDKYTTSGFAGTLPQSVDDQSSLTNTISWSDPLPIGKLPPF